MACLEIHRERQALARSMRDIDSAVGRCVVVSASEPFVLRMLSDIADTRSRLP